MTHRLPPEYFQNRQEQARIKMLIVEAIPEGVFYHNLIIALAELLAGYTEKAFREKVREEEIKPREGDNG